MLVALCFTSACLWVRWAPQAVNGQAHLLLDRVSLDSAQRDVSLPPSTRALLSEVPHLKAWGTAHGLKPTRNYQHFVALDRPAVAYVVSAAPPLGLQAHTWDFPVAGSFPYLGWFSANAARQHAASMALQGWDVSIRPVSTYSTLGWLPDPILSSMLEGGAHARLGLINTVLHESVHATVFLKDEGAFNETTASFVADHLTPLYLRDAEGPQATSVEQWNQQEADWMERKTLLTRAHDQLQQIYAADQDAHAKLRAKQALLWDLQQRVPARVAWNNASLMQFKTYDTGTAAYVDALATCGHNVQHLLGALRTVRAQDLQRHGLEASVRAAAQKDCVTGVPRAD